MEPEHLEGEACSNLSFAYCSLWRLQKAFEFCQRALRIAKWTGKTDSEGETYEYLGSCYLRLGDVKKRHSNSISSVLVLQKRLEKNKEKDWYMGTLV